jgi:hypothetical protein
MDDKEKKTKVILAKIVKKAPHYVPGKTAKKAAKKAAKKK